MYRSIVGLICAATLLLKIVVPAGYMIDAGHGRIAITICAGTMPAPAMAVMTTTMPGMHGAMPDHGKSRDHGKPELPCAFAGLSAAALGAIDPVLLAVLIAFVMAIGTGAIVPPVPAAPAHLRPPSHAPPARS